MTKISHDSETPAVNQQVITACAFIHHNFDGVEKLFWPKRADTKKFLPGVYELPGGHIDFGEDIVEGLRREIKEATRPIHPSSNGGLSLPDVARKLDKLEARQDHTDSQLDLVISLLRK